MRFHLENLIEENLKQGMGSKEARNEALKEFGGIEKYKEECRDSWEIRFLMGLLRDIRSTVYSLRKSPGFSLAVIGILALCIGANTTVLSALYSLVLKPLPFENSDQLVKVINVRKNTPADSLFNSSSWTQYLDFKEYADLFEGCALRQPLTKVITWNSSVMRVKGQGVSADFFDLVDVKPLLGRFFSPEEVDPGPGHLVVLTQTVWENEYESNSDVIGQQLLFDDNILYTIIGIAPRSVETFDFEAKFFIPYAFNKYSFDRQSRYSHGADLWMRLKEGVSREAGLEQLRKIEHHWYEEEANAKSREYYKTAFDQLEFDQVHRLKDSLLLLEGGALFVLLVGCLNVVNLLLSRAGQKCHELSIRNALGAGKFILKRLMLIESTLLTAVAMGIGILLTFGGLRVINQYLIILDPSAMPIVLDTTILSLILTTTGGIALLMGSLPIELLWKAGLLQRVDSSKRTSSAGSFTRKLSSTLVVGQVAVAFALLIGASLLFRSFNKVLAVEPGFEATRIIKGRVESLREFYKSADTAALKQRVIAGMQEIPGIQNVSLSLYESFMPYNGENTRNFVIRGAPEDASQIMVRHVVSPDYFTTMGIPILEGREFNPGDTKESTYIVDEVFARRFFKDRSAVGAEINTDNQPPPSGQPWSRIVGVVARANLRGLEQRDGLPIVYAVMTSQQTSWNFTILLRTSRPPGDVIKDMRAKLREIDPRLPLSKVETLQESLENMLLNRKGITLLFVSFAGLALLLSVVGIYAVLAYDVLQRKREIGIRIALGASKRQVLALILKEELLKTGIGLTLGVVGALLLSYYLSSLLFDIRPLDPTTYIFVSLLLFTIALTASYLPARRAANLDPLKTLAVE